MITLAFLSMIMQLYLITSRDDTHAMLTASEAKHLTKVMRARLGDRVRLMDGRGHSWVAVVDEITARGVRCRLLSDATVERPSHRLALAVTPTKQIARVEHLVKLAVELGVTDVHFIKSSRTLRSSLPMERLDRLMVASMKQCHRLYPMVFHEMVSLRTWLEGDFKGYDTPLLGVLDEAASSLFDVEPYGDVVMVIGPEGDLTVDEIEACTMAGCTPVQMGGFRLRTETAAIFAAMAIKIRSHER